MAKSKSGFDVSELERFVRVRQGRCEVKKKIWPRPISVYHTGSDRKVDLASTEALRLRIIHNGRQNMVRVLRLVRLSSLFSSSLRTNRMPHDHLLTQQAKILTSEPLSALSMENIFYRLRFY
jgi:hypothetical protein